MAVSGDRVTGYSLLKTLTDVGYKCILHTLPFGGDHHTSPLMMM